MGAAFLVTLREGIEAALIVSIVLAYLRQLERTDQSRLVWWGAGLATATSIAVGAIIFAIGAEFEGRAEELFEGLVSLGAVIVLTWMIFWMRRQAARIKSDLQERVDRALVGGGIALAGLAFFAVLREGVETALFLFGSDRATGASGVATVTGGLLGLATAILLGVLLYRGGTRINIRTFFKVTGALILVVAAGLFAFSVHELQEAGLLPFLDSTAFDISGVLSDEAGAGAILRAIFGYQANPTVLEVLAWAGYLAVTGFMYFRPVSQLSRPATQAHTAESS
ncbi:MAG: iron uptake transporter permease EfeU [Actinomycetota bacterium]